MTSIAPEGSYLPSLIGRVCTESCCVDPGGWALSDRLAAGESAVAGVLSSWAAKEVSGGRGIGSDDRGDDLLNISVGQQERDNGGLSGHSAGSQGEKSE